MELNGLWLPSARVAHAAGPAEVSLLFGLPRLPAHPSHQQGRATVLHCVTSLCPQNLAPQPAAHGQGKLGGGAQTVGPALVARESTPSCLGGARASSSAHRVAPGAGISRGT